MLDIGKCHPFLFFTFGRCSAPIFCIFFFSPSFIPIPLISKKTATIFKAPWLIQVLPKCHIDHLAATHTQSLDRIIDWLFSVSSGAPAVAQSLERAKRNMCFSVSWVIMHNDVCFKFLFRPLTTILDCGASMVASAEMHRRPRPRPRPPTTELEIAALTAQKSPTTSTHAHVAQMR